MNKTICLCDICGKEDAKEVQQFEKRKADAAGGMEDWFYSVDLCPGCIYTYFKSLVQSLDGHWLKTATQNKGRTV